MKEQIKNSTEFYGESYFKGDPKLKMSLSENDSGYRWDNNGAFAGTAIAIKRILTENNLQNVIDVGCGRGWVVHHLRNLGIKADGMEYSKFAVENSVCNSKYGDLTEILPYENNSYDLVNCQGILSHLTEKSILNALTELHRITKSILITNILIKEDKERQYYHLTVKNPVFWKPLFKKAGFVLDKKTTDNVKKENNYYAKEQWFSIWRKK